MDTTKQLDLAAYMSGSISRIMAKAYKNVLSNPREAKFAFRMQQLFAKSEKRRKKVKEQEDIDIPPFLISSISTTCNLHCKGCYARSNGIVETQQTLPHREGLGESLLTPEQWKQIFTEAADMGINFSFFPRDFVLKKSSFCK